MPISYFRSVSSSRSNSGDGRRSGQGFPASHPNAVPPSAFYWANRELCASSSAKEFRGASLEGGSFFYCFK